MAVPSNDFLKNRVFSYKNGSRSDKLLTYHIHGHVRARRHLPFHKRHLHLFQFDGSDAPGMHTASRIQIQLPRFPAVSVCVNGRQSDNGREVWSSPPGTVHTGPPFYNCAPHSWDHSRRSAPTVSTRSAPELLESLSTQN